jgi:hypothetical protein
MGRWVGRGNDTGVRVEVTETPWGWDAVLCLALVLTAALVHGMPSLLQGVKVVSDGPIYHLYFAARWWKAGRLILVAAPFGENAATYFPANGDLWFTWLMAAWGGDGLAKVGQARFAPGARRRMDARSVGADARQPGRNQLVRVLDLAALFLRAERRHNLRGGLSAGSLFPPRRRRSGWDMAALSGLLAAGLALGTKAIGVSFYPR